jgi:hypothetical protein
MNRVTVISLFAILIVFLIVVAAIGYNALGQLISALAIVALMVISLALIGAWLFRILAPRKLEIDMERNRHVETMVSKGYIPTVRGIVYTPIQKQVIASEPVKQIAAPSQGIHFTDSSLYTSVVNYLLFSIQLLGEDSKRLASNPECAGANIPGYNGRKWNSIIHDYLEPRYSVVSIPGPVDNGGGVYVPENIGTAKKLYDKVTINDALGAMKTTYK